MAEWFKAAVLKATVQMQRTGAIPKIPNNASVFRARHCAPCANWQRLSPYETGHSRSMLRIDLLRAGAFRLPATNRPTDVSP
jgi:hypothetical protein